MLREMIKAEIDELLQRLQDGQVSKTDRGILCKLLTANGQVPNQPSSIQHSKFNVNLAEGQAVLIGDRIIAYAALVQPIIHTLLAFTRCKNV